MNSRLNWHRHHDRIYPLRTPYPWRRVGFALGFVALCLVGSVIVVAW